MEEEYWSDKEEKQCNLECESGYTEISPTCANCFSLKPIASTELPFKIGFECSQYEGMDIRLTGWCSSHSYNNDKIDTREEIGPISDEDMPF